MIKKRWNLEEMRKRVENIKKVTTESMVNTFYYISRCETDDELDALYLTYYNLKDYLLKYKRSVFGVVNKVDYKPRVELDKYINSSLYGNYYDDYYLTRLNNTPISTLTITTNYAI